MKFSKIILSMTAVIIVTACVYYKAPAVSVGKFGMTSTKPGMIASMPLTTTQRSPLLVAEVGHVYRYHLHYSASGSLDLAAVLGNGASGQPRQTSSTKAEGELELACIRSGDQPSFLGRISLSQLALRANGQESTATSERAVSDLTRPFIVTIGSEKRSLKVSIPTNTAVMSANLLREIFRAMQIDLPGGENLPESWSTIAADANGEVSATYLLTGIRGDILTLKKTKTPVVASVQATESLTLTGEAQIDVDMKSGWLRNLTSEFVYDANRGSTAIGHSETSADFVWTGESADLPTWALEASTDPRSFKDLAMTAADMNSAIEAQLNRKALGDATFDSLKAELDRADIEQRSGREVDIHARTRQINQLYAWLELHPEDAPRFSARLAEVPQDSESFSLLLGSLYQTGHHEAQQALIEALGTLSSNGGKTVQILAVSGLIAHPDQALEDSIRSILATSHDPVISNTAALALGNIAGSLDHDLARHKTLVKDLAAYLQNAADLNRQNALIASLGGTMDPEVIPTLAALTHAPSDDVRGAAASALARIPDAKAVDEVVMVATSDADESVRYSATESLYEARLTTLANNHSLIEALDKEDSVRIRASLVRALWAHRSIGGKADQRVRNAAVADDSAEVRKVARTLIVGHDTPT